MELLSVVIITFNEEDHIARCISSVGGLADEIIVLDSGSTDSTAAVARSYGATVYQHAFRGYIEQKNYALQLASHDHILSLDADEALDAKLRSAIRKLKDSFTCPAYSMNRCTNFSGRFLHHGLWYPDKKIRLFDRRIARWGGINPHDKIILPRGVKPFHIEGDILHYSFGSIEELVSRNNRISSIAARSLYETGCRSNWYKLLVHPAWAFFNGYLLRLGFLDGSEGFSFAVNCAHQVFLKYAKLYRLQKTMRRETYFSSTKLLVAEKKWVADES